MASGYVNAGNLGIPIATYALGRRGRDRAVLLFQLAVLTPAFTTLLDAVDRPRAADGERPPRLRTLLPRCATRCPGQAAGLLVLRDRPAGARPRASPPVELLATSRCRRCCWRSGCRCAHAAAGRGDDAPSPGRGDPAQEPRAPGAGPGSRPLLGLSGPALLAVVVCAALPTAQNVFGYAVRFDQGVALGRDAGLVTTLASVPVLVTVVTLLD